MSVTWTEKYRPNKFSEVIGQSKAVNILRKDVSNPHNTYIFKGKFGAGKTTSARIFAAALNCANRDDSNEPCGVCVSCKMIFSGQNSPSVTELNASEHNSVTDARAIIEDLSRATIGLKKVFIMDECHNLSRQAWDTLLKVLESPPDDVHFILVTTDFDKIPHTVRNRSRVIDFKPISDEDMKKHLKNISVLEGVEISEAGLDTAVLAASGSVRSAIKSLENVIDGNISNADNSTWDKFIEAVADKDIALMLSYSSELFEEGVIIPQVAVERVFDLMVQSTSNLSLKNWTTVEKLLAIRELSKCVAIMGTTGSQKVSAQATFVNMCNPVEFDVAGLVEKNVLAVIAKEIEKSVSKAIKGIQTLKIDSVDFNAKVGLDVAKEAESSRETVLDTAKVIKKEDVVPEIKTAAFPESLNSWVEDISEEYSKKADSSKNDVEITSSHDSIPSNKSELVSFLRLIKDRAKLEVDHDNVILCCEEAYDYSISNNSLIIEVDRDELTDSIIESANILIVDLTDISVSFN